MALNLFLSKQQQLLSRRFIITRSFARSSEPSDETPADKARTFLVSIGHDNRIAKGVVDALVQNGMSGGMLLSTIRELAGRPEVGEDNGLEALVASVEQESARSEGKQEVSFWCVPYPAWLNEDTMMKSAYQVRAFEGMTLTDVAKFGDGYGASVLGEQIECACSGIMACSTCQVVIDDAWFDKVGEPGEAEQDMLDLAYEPTGKSRLGCQVVLSKELDGLVVKLPKGANNIMDPIPFQD
jgi:2Fe-2S ferredoxin